MHIVGDTEIENKVCVHHLGDGQGEWFRWCRLGLAIPSGHRKKGKTHLG